MAEACAATIRHKDQPGATALVVRREFISVNFDDIAGGGEGRSTATHPSRRPRPVAETEIPVASSRNQPPRQAIQAPIPRRAPQQGLLPPPHRPPSRSPAPPSNSPTPVGSVGGATGQPPTPGTREELREAATDAHLMWYLWAHADSYGLIPRPPSTDRKPMMYGTVYARPRAHAEHGGREVYDGGSGGGIWRGSEQVDARAGSERERAIGKRGGEISVCTFVLTTPDDDHRPGPPLGEMTTPRDEIGGSSGGGDAPDTGADGNLDVVVFVIPPGQPMFRTGWQQHSVIIGNSRAAGTGQDRERRTGERRSTHRPRDAAGVAAAHTQHSPPLEDVAEQARHLVERLLRKAMAHMRRDAAWRLFNKADGGRTHGPDELRRRVSESPHMGMSSPGCCNGGIAGGDLGIYGSFNLDTTNLRHLLALSRVTRLQDVDPRLSGLLAPNHDVNWGEWFQQLVDSPQFCTLVFEDGDTILQESDAVEGYSSGTTTRVAHASSGASVPGQATETGGNSSGKCSSRHITDPAKGERSSDNSVTGILCCSVF